MRKRETLSENLHGVLPRRTIVGHERDEHELLLSFDIWMHSIAEFHTLRAFGPCRPLKRTDLEDQQKIVGWIS